MDFRLDSDQEMICDAAASFLAGKGNSPALRAALESDAGYDLGLWRTIREELGWCSLAIPETLGGMELTQLERALLMEQLGRRLTAIPYLASACLATDAFKYAACARAQQRYLPALASGRITAALALPTPAGWDPDACTVMGQGVGDLYVLNGVVPQVLGGSQADLLLVPARLSGTPGAFALFTVSAGAQGVRLDALKTMDITRGIARLTLHDVRLDADARIDLPEHLQSGLRLTSTLAALALAAEQVGSARQCLDLTLAYISERTQFGRAISSFQAVKHRCAEMMVKLESARSIVYGAARLACGDVAANALELEVACAKSAANEALFFCAQEAIQLHGGVGFTWEYDPHLYFKRAQAARNWFGDDAACHARIAAVLCGDTGNPQGIEAPVASAAADGGDDDFRAGFAQWMKENLAGEFAALRHRGGPGDEDAFPAERKRWEKKLAAGGWTCVGWPPQHGGKGLSLARQVIYHEEYARAGGPGRMGHIGEGLIGPTLIAYGTEDQKQRFLPGIRNGTAFWCQGYSEPNAGSDLANVQTRAVQDPDTGDWIVSGQKVWTSLAHESQWIFLLARCEPGSRGNRGLIFLLMPLAQGGVEIRPIRQISGSAEFSEVFFDGARAAAIDVVGAPGEGWKIAMALLGFERGLSTLGQQMHFLHELDMVIAAARDNGSLHQPAIRTRIARAWAGLRTMRYNALRMLSGAADGQLTRESLIYKYYWSNWHRALGELAIDVLGAEGNLVTADDGRRARLQSLFLHTRADTIYAGTNEIQLNIIAERGLGMPREARG
jgi:alkylation response protein AidB-like acyl-CoA dehydrogenase